MKKNIPTPHDRFFRNSMSYPLVAKQFFETHLPESVRKITDLDTLQLRKDSYVDEGLRTSLVDMLYSVEMNSKKGYIYILVEHQSKSDPLMPFRLLKYMVLIMEQHIKEQSGEKLPLICPIVLYNGKLPYYHTTDLFKLFQHNESLAREIFLQPFHLIDLSQIPDEMLRQKAWSSVLLVCLKHAMRKGDSLHWIEPVLDNMRIVEEEGGFDLLRSSFTYLMDTGGISDSDSDQLSKAIHNHLSPKLEETIMTITLTIEERGIQKGLQEGLRIAQTLEQQGIEKGLQKGLREGLRKGRQETMKELAVQLLQDGLYSEEKICILTGLSLETIEALKISQTNN